MPQFDETALANIKERITQVESTTALEIVVRIVPQSSDYRDIRLLSAIVFSMIALVFVLFSPMVISPVWVLPVVFGAGGLGYLLHGIPGLTKRLTTATRREKEVCDGAAASFHEQGISATQDRTGVLLYCSLLENRIELVVDHPLTGRAPGAEWGAIARLGRQKTPAIPQRLHHMLDALSTLGAKRFPSTGNNPNELPNEVQLG